MQLTQPAFGAVGFLTLFRRQSAIDVENAITYALARLLHQLKTVATDGKLTGTAEGLIRNGMARTANSSGQDVQMS